jgi:branched-subunit amino acid transport protein
MATKKKNVGKKLLPTTVYEILRWVTWIVLPAIATLISALNLAWGWNWPIDAILSTFAAVETFIGVVLGVAKYTNDKTS